MTKKVEEKNEADCPVVWKALKAYDRFAYRMGDKILKMTKVKNNGKTKERKNKKTTNQQAGEQLSFSLGGNWGQRVKDFFDHLREKAGGAGQVVKYAVTGLLIVVVIAAALPLLPVNVKYEPLVVMSGSMSPAVRVGSLAVIYPMEKYNVGDIITFLHPNDPGNTVTHRIYETKEAEESATAYVTKGDANDSPDNWEINQSDIKGKVLFSIPLLGYLVNFSKTRQGFVFLIIIPAVLIIIDELRIIKNEVMKKIESQANVNKS